MKKTVVALVLLTVALQAFAQNGSFRYEGREGVTSWKKGRVHLEGVFPIYFGTCNILKTDMAVPGDNMLDNKFTRNFEFAFDVFGMSYRFSDNAKLTLGIRLAFDNYYFRKSVYFRSEGNTIVPTYPFESVSKTKIRTDYVGFPLGLTLGSGRFKFSFNVSAEFLARAITKCKDANSKSIMKEEISGINSFRSQIRAISSYNGIGLYVCYTPTTFFASKTGLLDTSTLTFGIVLDI